MFAETVKLNRGESISLTTGQVTTTKPARTRTEPYQNWTDVLFGRNDPQAFADALAKH